MAKLSIEARSFELDDNLIGMLMGAAAKRHGIERREVTDEMMDEQLGFILLEGLDRGTFDEDFKRVRQEYVN